MKIKNVKMRRISKCTVAVANTVIERTPPMQEIEVRSPVGRTKVVKTGSDSSTAKRSARGVSVTGPPL